MEVDHPCLGGGNQRDTTNPLTTQACVPRDPTGEVRGGIAERKRVARAVAPVRTVRRINGRPAGCGGDAAQRLLLQLAAERGRRHRPGTCRVAAR